MANKKGGKWFYIVGAILVCAWFLSRQTDRSVDEAGHGTSASRQSEQAATAPISQSTPESASLATATPTPVSIASPTPAPGTVVTVKPAIVANAQPTPIREPNPPSDNYVPTEVRLTTSTSFPVFEHGVQTGLSAPPIGTKVKLVKVTGFNVTVEYKGQQKSISASSTDLLQRMLGTADN